MNKKFIPLILLSTALLMTGCAKKEKTNSGEAPTSGQPGQTSDTPAPGTVVTLELAGQLGEDVTPSDTTKGALIEKTVQGLSISYNGAYKVFADGYNIRVYKNQTMKLSATKITKVELVCTADGEAKYGPGCATVNVGNYTFSGRNGTWTGDAAEVVFTAATNQVRMSSLKVTYVA